jgi:hypothetical protein
VVRKKIVIIPFWTRGLKQESRCGYQSFENARRLIATSSALLNKTGLSAAKPGRIGGQESALTAAPVSFIVALVQNATAGGNPHQESGGKVQSRRALAAREAR